MRKGFMLVLTMIFLSCANSGVDENCFPLININEVINLDLPQFIDLRVPGGHASARIGGRDILIIRRNSNFQAFDLQCPEQDCTSSMTFDGLRLTCPCNQAAYNSLDGSPLTEGFVCPAKEYLVENINGAILRITDF